MKIKTIVKFLTKTKIWFATIEHDGTVRRDFFNMQTLLYVLMFFLSSAGFSWKIIENGIDFDNVTILQIVSVAFNLSVPVYVLTLHSAVTHSLPSLQNLADNPAYKCSYKFALPSLISNLIFMVGMGIHNYMLFQNSKLSEDVLFIVSCAVTDVCCICALFGLMAYLLTCNIIIKTAVDDINDKRIVTLDHLQDLKEIVELVSGALQAPSCLFISNLQIILILVVFLSLHGQPVPIMFAIGMAIYVYSFLQVLHECYQKIGDIAGKAKKQSLQSNSIKDMTEIQLAADEVTALCPFSALGFFNLEMDLMTSMTGTTVNYLVILIQFVQST